MTKQEILNAINKRLLENTNKLIEERKQHRYNHAETMEYHRELLLLYNDVEESELSEEMIERCRKLM